MPQTMPLTSGARLGPHEILSPLGAGGMGEVYRARDTRLERTVAGAARRGDQFGCQLAGRVEKEMTAMLFELRIRYTRAAHTIVKKCFALAF